MGVKSLLETQLRPPSQFWTRSDLKCTDPLVILLDEVIHLITFVNTVTCLVTLYASARSLPPSFSES